MGFLGLFRPKWRHRDPNVRRAAVAVLEDEGTAVRVATSDEDPAIRAVAASRVTGERALRTLLGAQDDTVRRLARERLAGRAVEICAERRLSEVRQLLDGIVERSSLAELVGSAKDPAVRDAAFAKLLDDPEASQAMLARIAIQDAEAKYASRAIAAVAKRSLLKDVSRKAKREDARAAAAARLASLVEEAEKPSDEQRRRERAKRLRAVADRASTLGSASDPARALQEFAAIDREWAAVLADFPGLSEDQAVAEQTARVSRSRASAESRAERAREDAIRRRDRGLIIEVIATTGVPDDQRAGILARWAAAGPATPDEQAEFLRLLNRPPAEAAAAQASAAAAPAAVEPDDATRAELETLSAECESLVAADDARAAAARFQDLHKRWLQLTGAIGERHPLARRFTDAYAAFKQRRRDARDARDARDQERLEAMRELAARAERFAREPVAEDAQRARFNELNALQAEWRQVGPVRPALAEPVRARFRAALDQAYQPLKAMQEAEDWQRFAEAARAEELIARVEALAQVEDVAAVARSVREAHQAWKTLGELPRGKSRELWSRFKAACDAQYDRAKVVFAEQDAQRGANLEAKRALLAEVEELGRRGTIGLAGSVADRQAKQQALERVKEIQARWKEIGPVPREHDRELWSRFKAACDPFFAEGHRQREQEQQANLEAKLALCDEAERMAASAEGVPGAISADKQRWLKQVRELQGRWKPIGHVPMAEKEPVWQRFKAACDRVYALTREEVAAQEVERVENLAKKQALLQELESMMSGTDDPARYREDVKRLQLRWRDIGHVPRDQHEALRARWQELCDRAFQPKG